ncbi:amidohydrolase family protein [Kribbella sp. NPDC004875]|uniref:amidohydrolase family protein n=1 Tax=Kribbella sp. NPDC004875 TaxID=3364107 RepID=UPI0036BA224E
MNGERVVDVHSHALPMPLLDWLTGQGLAAVDRDVVRIDPAVSGIGRGAPIPLPRTQYDLDERVVDMQRMGVDQQLVSLPPFVTCPDERDPQRVIDVARRANDALVDLLCADTDKFIPLGFVPLGSPDALGEATRCLDELSCAGIALGTHGYRAELDDPRHESLWEMLADRQVFVFLHPNAVPGGERLGSYWLPQLAGFPLETALAVSRLVLGGVLDRHDLTLCLAHGGGCLPALQGRLDLGWERKEIAHTTAQPPSNYLSRLYYDTATFSTPLLRRLVEDFGSDHVLLGTDYPFDLADLDPRATVAALDLPTQQRQRIEGVTIDGLLARRA